MPPGSHLAAEHSGKTETKMEEVEHKDTGGGSSKNGSRERFYGVSS